MSATLFRMLPFMAVASVFVLLAWTPVAAPDAAPAAPKGSALPPRMPLSKFLKDERMVTALRKGVEAMKARKPYDPLSWFYQAAIHGVPPAMVAAEREELLALKDPMGVDKDFGEKEAAKLDAVFKKRYWNRQLISSTSASIFSPSRR